MMNMEACEAHRPWMADDSQFLEIQTVLKVMYSTVGFFFVVFLVSQPFFFFGVSFGQGQEWARHDIESCHQRICDAHSCCIEQHSTIMNFAL
jgi:hypothetical protein